MELLLGLSLLGISLGMSAKMTLQHRQIRAGLSVRESQLNELRKLKEESWLADEAFHLRNQAADCQTESSSRLGMILSCKLPYKNKGSNQANDDFHLSVFR